MGTATTVFADTGDRRSRDSGISEEAAMKPTWPSSGVHTPNELARKARRLGRHSLTIERVIRALQRGATLQLSFSPRQHWRLSTGEFISRETAVTVVNLPDVVGVGDTLFAGEPSQTYRYLEKTQEKPHE
jgi:hypothetical protein